MIIKQAAQAAIVEMVLEAKGRLRWAGWRNGNDFVGDADIQVKGSLPKPLRQLYREALERVIVNGR